MDSYSVALRLTLNNQITSGLIGISQAMNRVNGDAMKLKATLGDIKLLVTAGALTAGAGFMGLNLISKTLPDAKEYAHQLALMNASGMKQAEIARSIQSAWALNKTVPTSTTAANLEAIRELRTVFGDTNEAINFLPTAQKLSYILQNMRGGGDVKGEVMAYGRALDRRDATATPEAAYAQADLMTKAIVASGGVLTAKDFASTFMYGRSATLGWSNEFAYKILPSLMQEFKSGSGGGSGGGPGNPLMSAYNTVVQGTIPMKSLGVWEELGLLDPTKIVRTKTGLTRGVKPGGVSGSAEFIENPYAWVQGTLRPALEKAGYDTQKEQRQVMGYLFPNRTAGAVMTTMLFQNRQIERDRKMFGIAKGIDAYDTLMAKDPNAADAALLAQWKNLMAVIGYEILPILVPATLQLVDGLRSMADWGRENPGLLKGLVVGFGALSGAMAFSGTLMLLVGGMKALGLTLKVMGVGKLFMVARGLGAVGTAAPLAASGVSGFALALGRLIPVLGGLAAMGFVGRDILNSSAGASNMVRIGLGGGTQADKDLAAARLLHKDGALSDKNFNKIAGRAATARGASPYIAAGADGRGAAAGGNVYMDGKKVGAIVSDRIGQGIGHQYSVGRADPGVSLPNPAGGYSR